MDRQSSQPRTLDGSQKSGILCAFSEIPLCSVSKHIILSEESVLIGLLVVMSGNAKRKLVRELYRTDEGTRSVTFDLSPHNTLTLLRLSL